MPRRLTYFADNEIYHIFNRSVAREPIFNEISDYRRFVSLIDYYRFRNPPIRFSHYNRLESSLKREFLQSLHKTGEKIVEIYGFALMPNHFHFLIKQTSENGISMLLKNLQNAFAKYFNKKNNRNGSLFQLMFKGTIVENDDQLTHVLRYIHLNPLTGYVLKDSSELYEYPWTSFCSYMETVSYPFIESTFILKLFRSKHLFETFTLNQTDYQRKLNKIKHLLLE